MNPFAVFFSAIGIPLGFFVVWFLLILGYEPNHEGFDDLAWWIGICFWSGIVTTAILLGVVIYLA